MNGWSFQTWNVLLDLPPIDLRYECVWIMHWRQANELAQKVQQTEPYQVSIDHECLWYLTTAHSRRRYRLNRSTCYYWYYYRRDLLSKRVGKNVLEILKIWETGIKPMYLTIEFGKSQRRGRCLTTRIYMCHIFTLTTYPELSVSIEVEVKRSVKRRHIRREDSTRFIYQITGNDKEENFILLPT